MVKDISAQLDTQYRELQETIEQLERGECKAPDVKKRSALLGIYKERDNTYMLRIRRNAGIITTKNLRDTADIMLEQQIRHAHFSTRQNIQLHGVVGANVYNTITAFNSVDMPFRGGGGNTFRSVATSALSGVSATETFDTIPHTAGVWDWAYYYEKAYGFCRKFKLGFTSEESDDTNAGIQDLGFVAKIKDGERGFRVYGGGGMGRGANLGIELFDFLPEKDIIRVSQAMVDLFFDHGNREVRSKARLRFVLQERGEEEFRRLFMEYYEKADAPDFVYEEIDYSRYIAELKEGDESPADGFEDWYTRSVIDTKFGDDVKSVRLFVRRGNFAAEDLRALAEVLEAVGASQLRSANTQDAFIPLVKVSKLPELYSLLKEKLPDQAVTDGRFERHIISCIGAAECPIGILKAPEVAKKVADSVDELIKDYQTVSADVYRYILDGINISGCASSCGLNLIAGIGFHGMKKKVDGELKELYQLYVGGQVDESDHKLARTDAEWLVEADNLGEFVSRIVKEYLESFKAGNRVSLREYMVGIRDSFNFESYSV